MGREVEMKVGGKNIPVAYCEGVDPSLEGRNP